MSDEKRPYVKRKRAEDEAQTRARIAQAAMELHGSVGPAFTTISAVADRAGVRRATVYRHFADETALFAACSSRWLSQNPLPDIDGLRGIGDGDRRLAAALDLLYGYYRANAPMLFNVIRDAEASPALDQTLHGFRTWLQALAAILDDVLNDESDTADPQLRRAALGHALSFLAWHDLAFGQELPDDRARDVMCGMVRAASAPGGPRRPR
jgi:AcrR family transcriptional regulator